MATPETPFTETDPDVMAAELALGILEGNDLALALRRQLAEPAFARDVERWRDHFASLFALVPEHDAPRDLAEHIESELDRQLSAPAERPSPGRFWRPVAIGTSLLAASLSGLLLFRPAATVGPAPVPEPTAQMIAALAPAGKGSPVAAYYDASRQVVRMPAPMRIPTGRSAQLWAIVDGKPPIPLGLFRVVGTTIVASAPGGAGMAPGTTLAISFEPLGGSPTGQPTGPVVASGTLSKV